MPSDSIMASSRATAGWSRRIFLSYSRFNACLAEALRRDLDRAGMHCWMDSRDLDHCSSDWRAEVEMAISACDEVLLLISRESLQSKEVAHECRLAETLGKSFRRISLLPPEQLPEEHRRAQLYDWSGSRSYQALLRTIIDPGAVSSGDAYDPLRQLTSANLTSYLNEHCPRQDTAQIQGVRFQRCWIDASSYTVTHLFLPDAESMQPPPSSLALLLRFSGPFDRRSHEDVLSQRLDSGQSALLLLIEGPFSRNDRDELHFQLPNDRPHIWHDSLLASRKILNEPAIKRLSLDLYLDAPALLALRIGQDLDRERRFHLHQYDRATSRYCQLDI